MGLSDIREQIDAVDDRLMRAFIERMDLSAEVARAKDEAQLPATDKTREREVLAKVRAMAGDKERYADSLYRKLFDLSKSYQNRLLARPTKVAEVIAHALDNPPAYFPQTGTIAVSGVEGGYSQMAADRMFPRGNLMYFKTFEAVFDAVSGGLCDFGVLPIENSTNGSVRAVYDLIQGKHAYIVRSERLFVRHDLLAKPGTDLSDITRVISHEQALGQCSAFIRSLGGGVETVARDNTAEAVREVAAGDDRHAAAISSRYAGELYGLVPVAQGIQNSENNYTRFICIAREPVIYPGANRISLVLTSKHRPGALYEILGLFAALGINLLKLESCPIIGQDFDFMFFFDLEASVCEPGVIEMLGETERAAESFIFLGSYAEM